MPREVNITDTVCASCGSKMTFSKETKTYRSDGVLMSKNKKYTCSRIPKIVQKLCRVFSDYTDRWELPRCYMVVRGQEVYVSSDNPNGEYREVPEEGGLRMTGEIGQHYGISALEVEPRTTTSTQMPARWLQRSTGIREDSTEESNG